MRIIVCIKRVPDTSFQVGIDFKAGVLEPEDEVYRLNPADEVALEAALRIKEEVPGSTIGVITLGPPEAEEVLRRGLVWGADQGVHLCDPSFEGSDAYATATALAQAISRLGFDLILCGQRSGGSGQVGSMIAELLDIPQVSAITHLELVREHLPGVGDQGSGTRRAVSRSPSPDTSERAPWAEKEREGKAFPDRPWELSPDPAEILVHRRRERGCREVVRCGLPVLFSVDDRLNDPRYPPFPQLLQARRREVLRWDAGTLELAWDQLGLRGSLIRRLGISPPRPRPKKIFTPESSLPAAERMKLMLSGGLTQKKSGSLTEEEPDKAASQAVQFILKEKIVSPDRLR